MAAAPRPAGRAAPGPRTGSARGRGKARAGSRLRLLLLAAGLLCLLVASSWWGGGSPPLWSFLAPRAETVVTRAELVEVAEPDGRLRRHALVEVAWPPGAAASEEVRGLWSPHQRWHLHVPVEIVRDHPSGTPITVRIVAGRPVADRTDLYEIAYAVLFTVLGVVLTGTGAVLMLGRLHRRDEEIAE